MKDLLIVTACLSANSDPITRLMESCEHLGLNFKYYGVKDRFVNWKETKVDMLREFIVSECTDYSHILFTDGFDSWMLKDEKSILEQFKSFDSDIVISGERQCYPLVKYADNFIKLDTDFRYPCAGQFMGKTGALIDALAVLSSTYMNYSFGVDGEFKHNDQTLWQAAYLEKRFNMKVDSRAKLFLAAGDMKLPDIYINNNQLWFKPIPASPCAIHFNGPKGGSDNEKNMNRVYELYKETRL